MRVLAELIDLGMQLARATAAKALADLAQPDPQEDPAEPPNLESEPAPQPAQSAPPRRTAAKPQGAPKTKPTDQVQAFLRLATAVCECIALEARLSAGPATTRRDMISPALRADPRRDPLIKAFREATEHAENRGALRYEFAFRLDQDLTADPEKILTLPELFIPLCEELEFQPDPAKLPDEILGMCPATTEDGTPIIKDDPYCMTRPTPRATDPP